MYHQIVKQKIRQGFQELSKGNQDAVLKQFAANVHFMFAGDHALAGECHTLQGTRKWFERLSRLFPGIQFRIHSLVVNGGPWNTHVANHFSVEKTYPDGRTYRNSGVQIVRLRWGRIVEDYIYEDTQKLVGELNLLASGGVKEAQAAPVTD